VVATVFGVQALQHRESDRSHTSPIRFAMRPPPGWFVQGAGNRQSFAISPDGSKLAFTAMDDSGDFRVFLRDLSEMEPQLVPESDAANTVFWNPDGTSLFFTARGVLRRLGSGANATQVVTDVLPAMLSAMWPSADRMVVSNRRASASVPILGGTPTIEKAVYAWPQVLPDGHTILHVVFDPRTGRYIGRLTHPGESGSSRDLVETDSKVIYVAPGYLLYVRAGTLLAHPFDIAALRATGSPVPLADKICTFVPTASADFSVSDSGVLVYQRCISDSQLVWVDRYGSRVSQASPPGLALKAARLSPDGRRIATSVYDYDRGVSDVWLFDRGGTAGRRMAGPGLSHSPVWSPDGKQLVFARAIETTPKLFLRSLEGQEAEEALPRAGFQMPTDWSPDGRFVVYNNTGTPLAKDEGDSGIWAVDLQRGRRLVPLLVSSQHEANAAFSPDNGWIAFTSMESGRPEVYVQRLQRGDSLEVTGPRRVVSRHGAQALRWRADGRELFYLGGNGTVYAVPLRLNATPVIGEPKPLFQISVEARAAVHALLGFDVSKDGKQFVIPVVNSQEKPSLVVIQNWTRLLNGNGAKL
jgi:Tol biopolymer transport system component